jgi:hypothetical protein
MIGWPQVTEPLLRERQGMSNEQFLEFLAKLLEAIGTRELPGGIRAFESEHWAQMPVDDGSERSKCRLSREAEACEPKVRSRRERLVLTGRRLPALRPEC